MSYADTVKADAPLAWYRLGESSGTTMLDAAAAPHDGTYVGSPTLGVAGLLPTQPGDTAITVNGSNYGEVANGSWMNVLAGSALSFEAWWTLSDEAGGYIGGRWDAGAAQFSMVAGGDDNIYASIWTSAGQKNLTTPYVRTVGRRYHVVMTWDGTNLRLYVDGVQAAATAHSGNLQGSASRFHVGRIGNDTASMFHGTIDEASVYATVLSPVRVSAHYGSGTNLTHLVSAWAASQVNSAGYEAYRAGDGLIDTNFRWASASIPSVGTPQWLQADLGSAKVVNWYQLTPGMFATSQDPKDFKVQGSNDIVTPTWVDLDTRTGTVFTRNESQVFTFTNTTAYRYYRVLITATNGNVASITELVLGLGSPPSRLWGWQPFTGSSSGEYVLGVEFYSVAATWVTHLTYYETSGAAGPVLLRLRDGAGVLASVTDTALAGRYGWREVALLAPYPIAANTRYEVETYANTGYCYVASPSAEQSYGDLRLVANGSGTLRGVTPNPRYGIGTALATNNGSGYLVGVLTSRSVTSLGTAQVEAVYGEALTISANPIAQVESVYGEVLTIAANPTAQVESVYAEVLTPKPVFTADPAYAAAVLADAPLAYWKLDDAQLATVMTDYSGNARHGTYSGAALAQDPLHAGSVGAARGGFSGAGIASVASAAWMPVADTFTIEFWMRHENAGDAAGLVSRYSPGWIIWQRSGRLSVTMIPSGQQDKQGYTFTVGQVVHYVLVCVSGRIKVYLNGVLSASYDWTGTFGPAHSAALQIGGYAGGNYSGATMSDVAYYGTALSAQRVAAHYGAAYPTGATDPASVSGLVGRYDADAITGISDGAAVAPWSDVSGNAKHLATTGAGKDPVLKTGILNGKSVVRFDGSNDALAGTVIAGGDTTTTVIAVFAARTIPSAVQTPVTFQGGASTNSGPAMALGSTGLRALFAVGASISYLGGQYVANTFERWVLTVNDLQSLLYVNYAIVENGPPIAAGGYLMLGNSPTQGLISAADIAEVLVYNRPLSDPEIFGIDEYLRQKWFVTAAPSTAFVGWGIPRV